MTRVQTYSPEKGSAASRDSSHYFRASPLSRTPGGGVEEAVRVRSHDHVVEPERDLGVRALQDRHRAGGGVPTVPEPGERHLVASP